MTVEHEDSPAKRTLSSGAAAVAICSVTSTSRKQVSKRAAMIHLHGGFRGGSKEMMAPKVQAYLRLGYVCVEPQYRLSGEAKWPAQLEDVKAAVRWVRANAENLNIEPARIVVAGYSAGGLLALMASSTMGRADLEGSGGNGRCIDRRGSLPRLLSERRGPPRSRRLRPPAHERRRRRSGVPRCQPGLQRVGTKRSGGAVSRPRRRDYRRRPANASAGHSSKPAFPPSCTPSTACRTSSTGTRSFSSSVPRLATSSSTISSSTRGPTRPSRRGPNRRPPRTAVA